MTEYEELRERGLMHPDVLYKAYKDYMYLYKYLVNSREKEKEEYHISKSEMRNRINYILKNKIRQRDEISTLCWILGEEDVREKDKY